MIRNVRLGTQVRFCVGLGAVLLSTGAFVWDAKAAARVGIEGNLEVTLEPLERYYYPGQEIEVRVKFRNNTGSIMDVPADLFDASLLRATEVAGNPLPAVEGAPVRRTPPDAPPAEILPRRAEERTYALSGRFPALKRVGNYAVVWEHPQLPARSTLLRVIRAYDPDTEYVAEFRTSTGKFTVEFFPSVAPVNVKNFIDLANSGFYDKMHFHMVIPGILIQAGDTKGDGTGYPGYRVPPEFSNIRHLKGTLSMWHHPKSVDGGSQFFICLADQPQFDGHYTVIGQVLKGMETVEKIGEVPTTEDKGRRPFLPLEAVSIEQIRIRKR